MRIIFTPFIAGKPWNGKTLTTEPLGGSESAVGYLARALAKRGHECIVYTHGNEGLFDGVEYRHQMRLAGLGSERADVHIASRWAQALGAVPGAQCVLWLHDMGDQLLGGHKMVFQSQAHVGGVAPRDVDVPIPMFIIGNGVDNADFPDVPLAGREFGKLVWTSNPDRGLHVAARVVTKLRRFWPEMRLHVYGRASVYGWGPEAEWPYLPADEDREGVVVHEPLSKPQLAKELATAWAWLYPSTWPETFCIAALEAQAAGTPCLTVPYGALTETVKGGLLGYRFEAMAEQIMDADEWNRLSDLGREFAAACDWDVRAEQWEVMLNA